MLKVAPRVAQFPPDAVGHAVAHLRTGLNAVLAQKLQHLPGKRIQALLVLLLIGLDSRLLAQKLQHLPGKRIQALLVLLLIGLDSRFQFLILQRTTIAQTQIFQFAADAIQP